MAQGVAWAARELGVPATIVAPDSAPQTKLDAIERLGGRSSRCRTSGGGRSWSPRELDEAEGLFVHPVQDERVMAGNGTIGLELAEELPDADAVLVPWGGGGLFTGIASALAAAAARTRVYAVEPETGAPVTAALAAGEPREVDYRPSFVDGAGREGRAAGDVGARPAAARRRLRRVARRDRRRRAPARRAGARDRRGRGRARRRRRALRPRARARSSSASSRAATSTPPGWRRSSEARRRTSRRSC